MEISLGLKENCNIPRKRPTESRQQDCVKIANGTLQIALKCVRRGTSGTSCEHGHE